MNQHRGHSVAVVSQSHRLKSSVSTSDYMVTRERTQLKIFAEILNSCKKPRRKTKLIHETSLSWHVLNEYLDQMQLMGLLEVHDSPTKYLVTRKGRNFLEEWKEMGEIQNSQWCIRKSIKGHMDGERFRLESSARGGTGTSLSIAEKIKKMLDDCGYSTGAISEILRWYEPLDKDTTSTCGKS
jgi:predicted transcriptional regulator